MRSVHDRIILDDEFKHLFQEHSWNQDSYGYAVATVNRKQVKLHHLVLPKKEGFLIDHKNRNKLDNRRCNLRYATNSQNQMNAKIWSTNTSGFKGISWTERLKKWKVYISVNKKQMHLGYFTEINKALEIRRLFEEKYYQLTN